MNPLTYRKKETKKDGYTLIEYYSSEIGDIFGERKCRISIKYNAKDVIVCTPAAHGMRAQCLEHAIAFVQSVTAINAIDLQGDD